jgi:Actin
MAMAGDGAAATSASRTTVSSTGLRRMGRYASSAASSRSASSSFGGGGEAGALSSMQIDRRPLIVEFGTTIIRAGHADQFQPQHLIPLSKPLFDNSSANINNNKTESQWYVTLSPIIELIYDRLMVKPSSRYVVCVTQSYVVPTSFINALQQHLWNRHVPGMVLLNTLQVGPPSVFGIKRSLMVQIHRYETVCGCHSDGYVLPFTYQSIPIGYEDMLRACSDRSASSNATTAATATATSAPSTEPQLKIPSSYNDDTTGDGGSSSSLDKLLVDINNPNSIIMAILLSLQECPRDVRSHVVSNIIFSGEGVTLLPDVPRRVTKQLQHVLESGGDQPQQPTATTTTTSTISSLPLLGIIPVDFKSLRPLASRVALLSCAPYRPDIVAWVGASLYATTWMKYDDDESPIPWVYPPTL